MIADLSTVIMCVKMYDFVTNSRLKLSRRPKKCRYAMLAHTVPLIALSVIN